MFRYRKKNKIKNAAVTAISIYRAGVVYVIILVYEKCKNWLITDHEDFVDEKAVADNGTARIVSHNLFTT